ncbi:MAG: hypothetical protein A2622_09975 [Bdellovibrionales bacterium RIFCSPHIGHO2_01_FULL_40_29]|nr:MAG: hypothetical protein A2622_09975 [Bdellovibrionales bacterium RIFCSPHIGHO2_01_FULL_40_29]OFZ32426.1 MAG: hypothetical protein A3D17_12685 [Bdellovibrionales bacterium RIFCSPHIGHO2_02_FULL_40_15]
MKNKKVDRRILRTQGLIRKALIPLIVSKGYDAVTIQDVLDHANVGRSTFYAHFRDKDDLLLSGFDELMNELTAHVKNESLESQSKKKTVFKFSLPLLDHANQNRLLFKALLGNRGGVLVQKRAFEMVVELVKHELQADERSSKLSAIELEIKSHFYAGAFFSILKQWLEGRIKALPHELDLHFQNLCRI